MIFCKSAEISSRRRESVSSIVSDSVKSNYYLEKEKRRRERFGSSVLRCSDVKSASRNKCDFVGGKRVLDLQIQVQVGNNNITMFFRGCAENRVLGGLGYMGRGGVRRCLRILGP